MGGVGSAAATTSRILTGRQAHLTPGFREGGGFLCRQGGREGGRGEVITAPKEGRPAGAAPCTEEEGGWGATDRGGEGSEGTEGEEEALVDHTCAMMTGQVLMLMTMMIMIYSCSIP